MRSIVSPLSGIRSPFGLRDGVSVYAILGFDPALVFDFKGDYFRKGSSASTFGASITHAATTNATMVDADGLLKWRPHNLVINSGDLTGTGWSGGVTAGTVTTGSPFGTYQTLSPSVSGGSLSPAQRYQIGKPITSGVTYVGWALVKYSAGSGWFAVNMYDTVKADEQAYFDLQNGVVGSKATFIIDHGMIDYGDGWWLCWASANAASGSGGVSVEVPNGDGVQSCSFSDVILIAGTQFNRSDLGGMVNNPDTTSSYVPTTSSAVYAPRRGHHVYNGSAWVNEGLLHESEARTNLVTYSNDLSNAAWLKSAVSNTANAGVSPDGTSNANKVVPATNAGIHYTYQDLSRPSTGHSFSVYVASSGYGFATICAGSIGTADYYAVVIDLSDGTQTALYSAGSHLKTVTVEPVGSYYRVTISGNRELYYVVGASDTGTYTPSDYGFKSFQGDGTSGILVYGAHMFRSGLGGMVNNPDTSNSYVPTTSSAVYAPRRGHHVYDGSAWVNEGILHESEARTNLMTSSGDLTGADWEWSGGLLVGTVTTGSPFGTHQTISPRSNSNALAAAQKYQIGKSITSGSTYVGWALVKYSAGSGWFAVNMYDTGKGSQQAYFDLQNGVVGSKNALIIDHGMIDYGDGWWLCWASSNATSVSGGLSLEVPSADDVLSCNTADVLLIAGAQFNRSDLGGMVNNPDTANSYVPTTTTPVYAPRRGHHIYNGSAWVNGGILHESEARTNLIKYSNTAAQWAASGTTLTADSSTGPDGLTSMVEVAETATTAAHYFNTVATFAPATNQSYTLSAYVKKRGSTQYVQLLWNGTYNPLGYATFDLDAGTLAGTGSTLSTSITDVGGGVYRVSMTTTTTSTNPAQAILATPNAATGRAPSFAGNTANGFYVYGVQVEQASTPSSYIPTNAGATVTRAAETLTVPAANLPWPTPVETTGTELVTNGTFATDTDWTLDAASSITGGELVSTKTVAGVIASQSVSFVAGKVYLVTFDFTNPNNRILVPRFSGGTTASSPATTGSAGSYSNYITANAGNNTFQWNSAGTGFQGTIDNISVKEVNPLSVSIQMDGKMTGDTLTPVRWHLDANNSISIDVGTTDFSFTQRASGVVDSVTGGSFTSGTNVPFNLAGRYGSTFVNGAVSGTSLTANVTPTTLPNLSSTDLNLGEIFMGTIGQYRMWDEDITDVGITEAST